MSRIIRFLKLSKKEILFRLLDRVIYFCKWVKFKVQGYWYPRPAIQSIQGSDLVGAEIGVAWGDGSVFILKTLSIKKLYLIDPYLKYAEVNTENWAGAPQGVYDECQAKAHKAVKPYQDKVQFIQKLSNEAVNDVPELDFVYIDGNHEYEYVKQDLENYWAKLKSGGTLCGDNFESVCRGVVRAVTEFAGKKNLKIQGAKSEASYEWWIVK